jgi:RNA polymerase sigma factor (sigma-70 family)
MPALLFNNKLYKTIAPKKHIAEEELIKLLRSRDREAFEYFYDRYSAAVYGVILKIVKIEELSEEVLQDAFLKFWDKIGDYDSEKGRLFTWMINITRNMAIDKIRSKEFKGIRKTDDIADNVHIFDEGYADQHKSEHIGVKELIDKLGRELVNKFLHPYML